MYTDRHYEPGWLNGQYWPMRANTLRTFLLWMFPKPLAIHLVSGDYGRASGRYQVEFSPVGLRAFALEEIADRVRDCFCEQLEDVVVEQCGKRIVIQFTIYLNPIQKGN